ncbi:MAG: hypothetical protein JJT81_02825 [Rubellimicrobium sp.]|nr:hypothetical protein [Rubellimicrobium sp.]
MPYAPTPLPGALLALALASGASAQGALCLQEIAVTELGEVILNLGIGSKQERLVVLGIEVADILFDGAERLASAVHVTGRNPIGGDYQVLSIAAYPEGFAAQLQAQICGEDLLDVIDAYRLIGEEGDPMSGATGAFSPAQNAASGLWRRERAQALSSERIAAEEDALAVIAAFQARLPDRQGALVLNLRPAAPDPMDFAAMEARIEAIVTDTTLDQAEMQRRLAETMTGSYAPSSDPMDWPPCPCPMEVLEAHVLGPGGPPFQAESLSWGPADEALGGFGAALTAIAQNADGSYRIEGRFGGGVVAMAPAPGEPSALAAVLGMPDMVKAREAQPIWGEFRIDMVLPGSLSDLPKVF